MFGYKNLTWMDIWRILLLNIRWAKRMDIEIVIKYDGYKESN